MKSGLTAGFIAGLLSGIFSAIITYLGLSIGLYGVKTSIINAAVAMLLLTIFFGTLFGLLYERIYGSIPYEGVKKGLFFGLMIWVIKDITAGSYLVFVTSLKLIDYIAAATDLIVVGIYMWTIYGLVLGYLYKPTK